MRGRSIALVFACVVALAAAGLGADCGGDSDSSAGSCAGGASGSCVSRSGTYTAHYAEKSGGTCGPLPDATVGDAQTDATCSGSAKSCNGGCDSTIDVTCSGAEGLPYTEKGSATWSADGKTGTGTLTYVFFGNGGEQPATCTSTYDVTYTKQ